MRSYLLEPFKQVRIGLYLVGMTLVFTSVLVLLFFNVIYLQHLSTMEMLGITDGSSFWDLFSNPIVLRGLLTIGLSLIVFAVVTIATSIVLTHRIFGPLVSIRRLIRALAAGDYSARIQIRKKDDLHALADDLNALATSLEQASQRPPLDKAS